MRRREVLRRAVAIGGVGSVSAVSTAAGSDADASSDSDSDADAEAAVPSADEADTEGTISITVELR